MAKQISYKITDMDALHAAYPEIVTEKQIIEKVIDRQKLYALVKVFHSIPRTIPGVEIGAETETLAPEVKLTGKEE